MHPSRALGIGCCLSALGGLAWNLRTSEGPREREPNPVA